MLADLHTHTVASGHAYSTVLENLAAAQAARISLIGITDHGPALPGGAHPYHFWNLRVLPSEMNGLTILKGIEANVLSVEGNLDLEDEYLAFLDLVQIALHPHCGYTGATAEENTQAYVAAMKNPRVNIIAHAHNPQFPVDCRLLVEAAMDAGVLLELNNSSLTTSRDGSGPYVRQLAQELKEADAELVIGSDAHIAMDVGRFGEVLAVIDEVGIARDKILNFRPDILLERIRSKR